MLVCTSRIHIHVSLCQSPGQTLEKEERHRMHSSTDYTQTQTSGRTSYACYVFGYSYVRKVKLGLPSPKNCSHHGEHMRIHTSWRLMPKLCATSEGEGSSHAETMLVCTSRIHIHVSLCEGPGQTLEKEERHRMHSSTEYTQTQTTHLDALRIACFCFFRCLKGYVLTSKFQKIARTAELHNSMKTWP